MKLAIAFILLASTCFAANTNKVEKAEQPEKVEKEKKAEHQANKVVILERDKGSKKESDWKVVKECPLMFANNKKAKKEKK
jgi:hypothetical protein